MKSALSLTLIVCLVASAIPAAAQGPGPIAESITRNAVRLAADRASQEASGSAESNWSRVVTVASGAEVLVTVRDSKPLRCTFVQAEESALIVRTGRWQVVQTIARGGVQEIRTGRSRGRRALGFLGALGGFFGGAFVGSRTVVGGCEASNVACSGVGIMAVAVGGALLGYRAITHTKGDLIYRAP